MSDQQRDRTNTVYYDAQPNFGTPPKSSNPPSSSDNFKMAMRKGSGGGREHEVLYESVHTERRHHTYSRDPLQNAPTSSRPVMMAPVMSSSYDYSIASPSAHRAAAAAGGQAYRYPPPQQHEEFKPGPRASSAANIDALFASKKPRSQSSSAMAQARVGGAYPVQQYPRNHRNMDYSVIGAYSTDRNGEQLLYGSNSRGGSAAGSIREHPNDYELDPRLQVTYSKHSENEWKRHQFNRREESPATGGYTPRAPRQSPSFSSPHQHSSGGQSAGRPRFPSDSYRHVYEEVPMHQSASQNVHQNGGGHANYRNPTGYGSDSAPKETAILDDYDNVPNEFLEELRGGKKDAPEEGRGGSNIDGESAIYQPGRYQPSEDAGSSSDEDDPEYLELMERDSIINRYEKGPDAADVDPWENPQFEVYDNLDRFGFVHKKGAKSEEASDIQKRRIVKELGREKKWLKMIEIWKSGGPSKKMEDRIWKGIPEKLRIVVWPRLLGAERMKHEKRDVYAELLLRARLVSKDIKQIDLDINRTYRDHLAFRKRYDVKQKSLLNVLAAYSMYNTEVGYCQGMSQIAALFLMYLDEEDAFWSLHQLMVSPKHTMHGFFVPGFPKLQRFEEHFKRVLKKYKPRIFKHLEKQDIPFIYLTKWWFGCFLDRVPFSLALRLWDVFLVEGDPILIAMAFNIMKMHEKTIRKTSMESFMEFIQNDIAQNFGYSDDEVMYSLRETLTKFKSDRQHVPPPPSPEDLSEVPTKALGPILHKPMASIREEIHEIQSRRSRANSTGRSPHPKRKESSRGGSKGPPPVTHKWNGNASQDSIGNNSREVPFEIPTRRVAGSPAGVSDSSYLPPMNGSKRDNTVTPTAPSNRNHQPMPRGTPSTPSTQRLRDERNGQMVILSRASDSEGDVTNSPVRDSEWSTSSAHVSRITHSRNNITRIELDGEGSDI